MAKRTFREVTLLKNLSHENLVKLHDVYVSPQSNVYLVTELLATDLGRLIEAKPLDTKFVQYFTYQILRGLKYIHSAGVVHRDLKPTNLLVNDNCDLKICDFGLARTQNSQMTGYVTTRYYRAPETMLSWQRYGAEVDLWSTGCIIAEMLRGKPLFPGQNHINQFYLILDALGSPDKAVLDRICTSNTAKFVKSIGKREPRALESVIPQAGDAVRDLLEKLLIFDPQKRISAEEGLKHPFMAPYHDPTDEPIADRSVNWMFDETELSKDALKEMIYLEVLDFHYHTLASDWLSGIDLTLTPDLALDSYHPDSWKGASLCE